MSASNRICPRCQSPRVDGECGTEYTCGMCSHVFSDPLDRTREVDVDNHRGNLSENGKLLQAMNPSDWPAERDTV